MPKSWKNLGIIAYFVLFLGLILFNKIIGITADYLWFRELALMPVFTVELFSKWGTGILSAVTAWAVIYGNLYLARHLAKRSVTMVDDEDSEGMARLRELLEQLRPFLLFGSFLAAFFIGSWAASHWDTILRFRHAVPFGSQDPIFDKDIGFYVFSLPFYRALLGFFKATFIFSGLFVLASYILGGQLLFARGGLRIAPRVRNHLFVLGGMLCLVMAAHFQLKMYGLLDMQRLVAPGPGYADLKVYLPALAGLRFVALALALLFWAGPFFSSGGLITSGLGVLLIGVLASGMVRGLVQHFIVAPNEITKETPYIRWAIEFTRKAFGTDEIQELEFDPAGNLTPQALKRNDLTVKNIRLWDYEPLLTSYSQLQEIRTYYDFMDVDNDRYYVNGEYRQVMLSPRELNPAALPSRIWINEHLTYTHGYGLTLGPVNRISPEGLPEFFIKDIPPQASTNLKVTRPEIYYGEARGSYVIVNTESKEFDYPSGDENIYTSYHGTGGVPFGGFLKRILFALRFKELKIVLSGDMTPESRILYHRNIRERLSKAAPFLRYDRDAYLVLSDEGRLFWILDAYTTADSYPFSERIDGVGNYIRNSVKAVVDAYNGDISFYMTEEKDPVIRTYARIFPDIFKPISDMPADLRSHIRYPQDLFSIQAQIYATYHMTDPQVFYNKEDLWKIPDRAFGNMTQKMPPYYTIMKLASVGKQEEFILMVPFTPARKKNMIAWMAARCDAPNYGKLLVYNFPKQKLVYGPRQIESRIDQDAEISKQLTLWDQGGSKVLRGSLLVIPVDSSLLYVQPLYLEATGGGLPELKRVIVTYGNTIAMEEDLEKALASIFSGRSSGAAPSLPADTGATDIKSLIRKAQERFDRANAQLKRGDLGAYGQEMKEVGRLLEKMSKNK